MTEVQAAMLLSPGLAAKNTMRGSFWPTSILYSAEDRGREASWADWFITRGGGKAEPGSTEVWAWPSCARRQGTPAAGSLSSPVYPPLVTSNIPSGLGMPFSYSRERS